MGARLHPLDCPIWTALTTHQASFGEGGARARRFRADVSPFFAAADDGPASVSALAALVHEDDDLSLLERAPPQPPAGIALRMNALGLQMVALAFTEGGSEPEIVPLGDRDAPEMVALAELTRPGPFRPATHKLGRFIGVRDGSRLVAMAGERLHADDFIEISAVCTHPEYRGRGYGAALMRVVGQRILADGAIPFLHTYASNVGAIALYRKLGFDVRCEVTHAVWSRDVL